jgi:glycine/D-amino acid oxidase-like deaminating enzyme
MSFSYWENKHWLTGNDFTIVGSGIVGLTCAIYLKERFPKAKINILEKGVLPQGASTKNAGFACFGSVSELLGDLKNHSSEEVVQLIKERYNGLQTLRNLVGDIGLDYHQHSGYELFTDQVSFENCNSSLEKINKMLFPLFKDDVFHLVDNKFNFKNCLSKYITNKFEGQLDPGKMMSQLLRIAQKNGVKILNNTFVKTYSEGKTHVKIHSNNGDFTTSNLLFATNGFSKNLVDVDVVPARAQVLITKPLVDLSVKGVFHMEEGYYYFRNIDNRILIGGGRNLDFKTEETTTFGQTELIQSKLEKLLRSVILPGKDFQVDYSWSGVMGVGTQKKPILKQLSDRTYCGVRLGGMGVAIGCSVGKQLAALVD